VDNLSHQIKTNISEIVFHTHFQDTHEHLPPEFQRIEEKAGGNLDFSYLFSHYLDSDLLSAGMLQKNYEQFFGNKIDSNQKWKLVSPFIRTLEVQVTVNVYENLSKYYGKSMIWMAQTAMK
jgi:hypothetical protein